MLKGWHCPPRKLASLPWVHWLLVVQVISISADGRLSLRLDVNGCRLLAGSKRKKGVKWRNKKNDDFPRASTFSSGFPIRLGPQLFRWGPRLYSGPNFFVGGFRLYSGLNFFVGVPDNVICVVFGYGCILAGPWRRKYVGVGYLCGLWLLAGPFYI